MILAAACGLIAALPLVLAIVLGARWACKPAQRRSHTKAR